MGVCRGSGFCLPTSGQTRQAPVAAGRGSHELPCEIRASYAFCYMGYGTLLPLQGCILNSFEGMIAANALTGYELCAVRCKNWKVKAPFYNRLGEWLMI